MPHSISFPLSTLNVVRDLRKSSGGLTTSVVSLCESMGALGLQVNLFAQTGSHQTDSDVIPDFRYVTTHWRKSASISNQWQAIYSPFLFKRIEELCEQINPHIIHSHGIWSATSHAAVSVARRQSIALVIGIAGMLQPWALSHHAWRKRVAWLAYQRSDITTACLLIASAAHEAEAIRRIGFTQPIAIIPNGLAMPLWIDRVPCGKRIRDALFLSRIHPVKGLLNLVTAWARTRPQGWRMIVAGPDEGYHLAAVKQVVQKFGLQRDFEFVGAVEGEIKERLYRCADLFILPSWSENFGNVVVEALSYGIPVITTHGTPWQELVTNRCGWWVDIGADSLAEAIQEATSLSDIQRQEMGRRGRSFVEKEFSSANFASKMVKAYSWILGFDSRPAYIM